MYMKKVEKREDPEFLKQVLSMTSDEIENIDNDTAIRIALLKAPDGYRLVLSQSRQPIITHTPSGSNIQSGKTTSKYVLVKEGEDAIIPDEKPKHVIDLGDEAFLSYFKD